MQPRCSLFGDWGNEAAAEIPVYRGHRWLEPDVAELRSALRRVATDQSAREAVACRGAADVRVRFSLQQACEAVEDSLRAAEGRFQCRAPAAVQACQVHVELEGELFAGHSFSNVNDTVSLRLAIALSLRRVRLNPTYDSEAFHAHELRYREPFRRHEVVLPTERAGRAHSSKRSPVGERASWANRQTSLAWRDQL